MDLLPFLFAFICLGSLPSNWAVGPPTVVQQVRRWQHARAGEVVRLTCPVEADPPAFLQWFKDEETIHTGWERYRTSHSTGTLKIKEAMEEDSGNYECKATNGFGSVSVEYYLHVSPNNSEVVTPPPQFTGKYYPGDKKPYFIKPEMMPSDAAKRPLGGKVKFVCKADGDPDPTIAWYKDNKVIRRSGRHPHWSLRLENLNLEDIGQYTCVVTNRAGSINYTYTLMVEDTVSPPAIEEIGNVTADWGPVILECKVTSEIEPRTQWLKLVEHPGDIKNKNTTIEVQGKHFIVLNKTSKVYSERDGTWMNKLVLTRVSQRDSGLYICLAANSMGYSVRRAYLTVHSDLAGGGVGDRTSYDLDEDYSSFDSPSLPLIIAVPAAVIVIIVIISIYVIYRRKFNNSNLKQHNRAQCRVPPMPPQHPDKQFDPYQAYQSPPHLHPMLPQKQQVPHHGVLPGNHMHPHSSLLQGAPSRERILKNYSDIHSDASLAKVPMSPQPHMQTFQHHPHMQQYGC